MSLLKTSERGFSRELPDVQSTLPDVRINLTRVGVKNVKKLVEVTRPGKRPVIFISNFDIFVDLPGSLKGAKSDELHLSDLRTKHLFNEFNSFTGCCHGKTLVMFCNLP